MKELIPSEVIENKIYLIRGQKVMIDIDLARLYGVELKRLNEQVRRNIRRFPVDFMFQLTTNEFNKLRSHFATTKYRMRRYMPYAFTEQGVAMLSSALNSERAIDVNIAIMRAFVRLRRVLATHKELARKFKELEGRVGKNDEQITAIFEAIRQLMEPPDRPKRRIGFEV